MNIKSVRATGTQTLFNIVAVGYKHMNYISNKDLTAWDAFYNRKQGRSVSK